MNNFAEISIDPVTLEVIRNKLEGIANEMQSTLLRSSFSTVVKEGRDASASLFTIEGETLAQSVSIPIHLATLIPIIETFLETFPLPTMKDGDLYMMNDPYLGGTHLPDIAIAMPVFHEGRIVAISAAITHHQDVGGMSPGSVPPTATEIYQEGLRIPPMKYRDQWVMNETLVELMKLNVRIPDILFGDIGAQVAACTVGARRLGELAGRYGNNQLLASFAELLDRSEKMTRDALRTIPDGTYPYTDYLDNDGIDLERPVKIQVAVSIENGTMHCDFEGTDPQTAGPFNAVPSGSQAAAYYAVRALTDASIPTNGGCFRPVTVSLPEGSLLNPVEPAPVNSRTASLKRVCGSIIAAFKDIVPDKIPADSSSALLILSFGGVRDDGSRYIVGEFDAGGSGGGPFKRRRGCHRNRRQQLHEPAGRGARAGGTASHQSYGLAPGLGRHRRVPRRSRMRAGNRAARRRRNRHPPGRAPQSSPAWVTRRRQRHAGPHHHPSQRRPRRGGAVEEAAADEGGRSYVDPNRGWRRLWRSGTTRPGSDAQGYQERQSERPGGWLRLTLKTGLWSRFAIAYNLFSK